MKTEGLVTRWFLGPLDTCAGFSRSARINLNRGLIATGIVAWVLGVTLFAPPSVRALMHEDSGWRITRWTSETEAVAGETITYHIRVERLEGDAGEMTLTDARDQDNTIAYLSVTPTNDFGGATLGGMGWRLPMNEGDVFEATYMVQVRDSLAPGAMILNYIMVNATGPETQAVAAPGAAPRSPAADRDAHRDGDPDPWAYYASLDYILWTGCGNRTTQGNPGAGVAGDPINTATGEFAMDPVTDLDLGGPLPLRFTRWYASRLNDPERPLLDGSLGQGWMHAFDVQGTLRPSFGGRYMRVNLPGGKVVTFGEKYIDGGIFRKWGPMFEQEPANHQLDYDNHNFWMMDAGRELVYRLENVGFWQSGPARALEILDRNYNSLQINRNEQGLVTNVTDGIGRHLDFTYDGQYFLRSVSDGMRTVRYGPDANGVVAAVTNALGDVMTYAYDPVHSFTGGHGALMTEMTYPRGNTPYAQAYDADGKVVSQTDVHGASSTFQYDGASGVTRIDDPMGMFTHAHANYRQVTNLTNQAGDTFAVDYETIRDLPTRVTDRQGNTTRITYEHASRRPAWIAHPDGGTTMYHYVWTEQPFTNRVDGTTVVTFVFRDLAGITHPDGRTETFHRDARGNVTNYVDRAGASWGTTYNHRGQPLTLSRPDGGMRTFTYHADGTLASETNSDDGVTVYVYDALRRLTGIQYPDGSGEQWALDARDRVTAHTNRVGGVTTFAYDANDNLIGIIDPAGRAIAAGVDLMDRFTNRTDSAGLLSSWTYDDMGRVRSATDPAGVRHFVYDARGWLVEQTRGDRTWRWAYDPEGNITNTVSPLGYSTVAAYDSMGRTVGLRDPLGFETQFEYDIMGRMRVRRNPLDAETRYEYDAMGRLTAITNALGEVDTHLAYDADGNLARVTDGEGHAVTFGYTRMGRLIAQTNALGEATRFTYDSLGRLERTDHADDTFSTLAYDASGRIRQRIDETGAIWSFAYNARNEQVAVTNPSGGVVQMAYHLDGSVQSVRDSDVATVSNRYDAARRLAQTVWPDGAVEHFEYNEHHELTAWTDARGGRTTFVYDLNGRLVRVTDPLGHHTGYAYDAAGRLIGSTNRTGGVTTYTYDAAGRLTAEIDPTGVRTVYTRDALGRITETGVAGDLWRMAYNRAGTVTNLVSPSGRHTAQFPDALQRMVQTVNAAALTNRVTYDARGRLASQTDAAGLTTLYRYDPRGLLAGVELPTGESVAYAWNELGRLGKVTDFNEAEWNLAYTPMGRLARITDPLDRETEYTYDTRGQLDGITFADGDTLTITRDGAGNVTRRVYSGGPDLTYTQDALNRLMATEGIALVRDAEGRVISTVNTGTAFSAAYDAAGRLVSAGYPSTGSGQAFTVTYTYDTGPDGNGLLTGLGDTLTGTQIEFVYDDDHRLIRINYPGGRHTDYTWDDADRPARIQSHGIIDVQLTLDPGGRIASQTLSAPLVPSAANLQTSSRDLPVDAASQLSGPDFAYDPRGRLTHSSFSLDPSTFSWDGASRLTGINGVTLTYNGLGQVRDRTQYDATLRYYYNHAVGGAPIVAERDADYGAMLRYYVWTPGGRLLYMIDAADGNKVYFYHFDQVGSTLALTDSAGTVTDAWAYDPYGRILERTGSNPQPFTFIGAHGVRQEGDGGLYQMRARYYDANTGRFLSPEPDWPRLGDPRMLNPYQYAGGDPLRFIDPTGLSLFNHLSIYHPDFGSWEDETDPVPAPQPSPGGLVDGSGRLIVLGGDPAEQTQSTVAYSGWSSSAQALSPWQQLLPATTPATQQALVTVAFAHSTGSPAAPGVRQVLYAASAAQSARPARTAAPTQRMTAEFRAITEPGRLIPEIVYYRMPPVHHVGAPTGITIQNVGAAQQASVTQTYHGPEGVSGVPVVDGRRSHQRPKNNAPGAIPPTVARPIPNPDHDNALQDILVDIMKDQAIGKLQGLAEDALLREAERRLAQRIGRQAARNILQRAVGAANAAGILLEGAAAMHQLFVWANMDANAFYESASQTTSFQVVDAMVQQGGWMASVVNATGSVVSWLMGD